MLFEAETMLRHSRCDIFSGTKLLWCSAFLGHGIAMSESSKTNDRKILECVTCLAHVISGLCLARYSVLVHDLTVQKWSECHPGRGYMLGYIAGAVILHYEVAGSRTSGVSHRIEVFSNRAS